MFKMSFVGAQIKTFYIFQLDCGIHPGLSGMDALPFVDLVEADEIDLLLISQ
jgi:Cft2 family RNA processing exonuclease